MSLDGARDDRTADEGFEVHQSEKVQEDSYPPRQHYSYPMECNPAMLNVQTKPYIPRLDHSSLQTLQYHETGGGICGDIYGINKRRHFMIDQPSPHMIHSKPPITTQNGFPGRDIDRISSVYNRGGFDMNGMNYTEFNHYYPAMMYPSNFPPDPRYHEVAMKRLKQPYRTDDITSSKISPPVCSDSDLCPSGMTYKGTTVVAMQPKVITVSTGEERARANGYEVVRLANGTYKRRKNGRLRWQYCCHHGRVRSVCKECGGTSICEHHRERSKCKECGGVSICSHGRVRSQCRDCGGASICSHGRQRSICSLCQNGQINHGPVNDKSHAATFEAERFKHGKT